MTDNLRPRLMPVIVPTVTAYDFASLIEHCRMVSRNRRHAAELCILLHCWRHTAVRQLAVVRRRMDLFGP